MPFGGEQVVFGFTHTLGVSLGFNLKFYMVEMLQSLNIFHIKEI